MTHTPDPTDDPAVTGVPSETPEAIRPSATGLVTGPIDDDTDVDVADVDRSLEDSKGGSESNTLDAPQGSAN